MLVACEVEFDVHPQSHGVLHLQKICKGKVLWGSLTFMAACRAQSPGELRNRPRKGAAMLRWP